MYGARGAPRLVRVVPSARVSNQGTTPQLLSPIQPYQRWKWLNLYRDIVVLTTYWSESIIEMVLVDRSCTMGVCILFPRLPYIYLPRKSPRVRVIVISAPVPNQITTPQLLSPIQPY